MGDKAYNVYALEDILKMVGIDLLPMRKENSKRPAWLCYLQAHYRKMIETTVSLIERLLPKSHFQLYRNYNLFNSLRKVSW